MRLPRDVSGRRLAKALGKLGYAVVKQRGSHLRLATNERGYNRVIVTDESSIPVGTLHDILAHVAQHFEMTISELVTKLGL